MAKREIEEADLLAQQQVVGVVADIMNNAEARKLFLSSKKIARPNEPIPEIDAAAPIRADIDEMKKMLADEKKAREEERKAAEAARAQNEFESRWDKQRATLRDSGWLAEGIEKVEKFAHERTIPDLEAAAALYEKLNPPAAPTEPMGRSFMDVFNPNPDEDTDMKKLLETRGNSEGLLNKMIGDALREVRGQPRR